MECRIARLALLITPTKKGIFEEICNLQDLTPSQAIRQLIRNHTQQYDTQEQMAQMLMNAKMVVQ